VAAYRAGATIRELGAQFGVWRGTVGRNLKARDINTRAPKLGQDGIQEAARLYRTGWTLIEIAEHYGVGYNTMRVRLISAGMVMRPKGRKSGECSARMTSRS
jgi:hypothetical protein